MRTLPKVFGIGLNKTGTTSLGVCLTRLGFRHASFNLHLLKQVNKGDLRSLFEVVDEHDSFEDWPYPLVFDALDQRYPGSRFILTRRLTPSHWLRSLKSHALRTDPKIGPQSRALAYGFPYPQHNLEAHLEFYENHLRRVRTYFMNRPDDLLEVCWEEQANWEPLCRFLRQPIPADPFPHANAAFSTNLLRRLQNEWLIHYGKSNETGDDPALPQ